jgi:hypothetical protein
MYKIRSYCTNTTRIGGSRQGPVSGKIKTPAGDALWGPEIETSGAFLFYEVSNLSIILRNVYSHRYLLKCQSASLLLPLLLSLSRSSAHLGVQPPSSSPLLRLLVISKGVGGLYFVANFGSISAFLALTVTSGCE